ncbi:MAG: hypothetical protein JXR64_11995, partial [Spirochaetales bacterium]|nr:hypothetical protein [Spirochaetales bacterium]
EECLNKLTNSSFSGDIPIYEISLLGVILQTLEVGDSNIENIKGISSLITVKIKNLTNKMITEFSKSDKKLYYLNDNIEAVLSLSLAVLILRLNYKIPFWHGNWGDTSQEDWGKDEKVKILSSLIKKSFGIETTLFDLDNILLQFHSLVLLNNQRIKQRLRTVICCFEGVGIAAYLQTILQQEIEDIEIIEATAVYKLNQEYIDKKQVELVISTFPINDINIPVIEVSLPLNKGEIISQITSSAKDINKTEYKIINKTQKESTLSFDIIIDFIHYFKLISFENIYTNNEIIGQLSKNLTTRPQDEEELNLSLQKREDLGPLYFDEYGIKILHCKSRAVTVPTAGVIEFHDKSIPRIIYMIAPDPCSDIYRKLLSTITVSFLENRNFRNSVQFGNIDEIRKNLMNIYKELI